MDVEEYLSRFDYGRNLSLSELWREMDRVWDQHRLDNTKIENPRDLQAFYTHPVWILNGLFAEHDPESIGHREAIARFIAGAFPDAALTIADYGGGSGLLAKIITEHVPNVRKIDVIEPWPFDYFCHRFADNSKVNLVPEMTAGDYDVVVAQDVLEHVYDPISTALICTEAVRIGGVAIFANCFHPVIKCHLPGTFYLRHTFKFVVNSPQLRYKRPVEGAGYAHVFEKRATVDSNSVKRRARVARFIGPSLNAAGRCWSLLRHSA